MLYKPFFTLPFNCRFDSVRISLFCALLFFTVCCNSFQMFSQHLVCLYHVSRQKHSFSASFRLGWQFLSLFVVDLLVRVATGAYAVGTNVSLDMVAFHHHHVYIIKSLSSNIERKLAINCVSYGLVCVASFHCAFNFRSRRR